MILLNRCYLNRCIIWGCIIFSHLDYELSQLLYGRFSKQIPQWNLHVQFFIDATDKCHGFKGMSSQLKKGILYTDPWYSQYL
ncbi:hypothetical protein D3C74_252330 [compost metagenome]